jgi:hypothetical protein
MEKSEQGEGIKNRVGFFSWESLALSQQIFFAQKSLSHEKLNFILLSYDIKFPAP